MMKEFIIVLFSKYDQVNEDEMGRECSSKGKKRNAHTILVGKPGRKRPLRRLSCR
jgi:hypothetical protein